MLVVMTDTGSMQGIKPMKSCRSRPSILGGTKDPTFAVGHFLLSNVFGRLYIRLRRAVLWGEGRSRPQLPQEQGACEFFLPAPARGDDLCSGKGRHHECPFSMRIFHTFLSRRVVFYSLPRRNVAMPHEL